MNKDIECRGCTGVENLCTLPLHINKIKCPCLECLLKSMCFIGCKEYNQFVDLALDLSETKGFLLIYVCGNLSNVTKRYLSELPEIIYKVK